MKKILLLLPLFGCFKLSAQDYIGFNQSNYAGVSGVYQQPASIVDSRMKFDMTLVGFNLYAYNNYIGIKGDALKKQGSYFSSSLKFPAFDDKNFSDNYVERKINTTDKALYLSNRINGPSFMVNLNHKNALAFSSSIRSVFNVDGLSPDLAKLAYSQFEDLSLLNRQLTNLNLSAQEMSWAEYGLTFAHVFKEDNQHYFKAGATVKLLQGIQSAYVRSKKLSYNFLSIDTVSFYQSEANYGHSDNFDISNASFGSGGNGSGVNSNFSQSYPGIGFDFGFVYEWRPDYKKFKYDMDGKKNLWRKDKNKYKLKIGLSITDLGSIKFKKGANSGDLKADVGLWNLKPVNPQTFAEFEDTINNRFNKVSTTGQFYKMNLPTAFSLQIDYNIWKAFYLNLTPFIALQFKNKETKIHDISSVTITPRWDNRWFGAFIPLQYNFMDGFRTGLALRVGPLIVGTSNLAPIVGTKKTIYGADIYTMLKIPIHYSKPKDKDKDGVSDKKDQCKNIFGIWELMGCPDKDGDHIKDSEDKCPDIAGVKQLHGCPDRDGDGITDLEDDCPDDKGLIEFKGCPDKDGDTVLDKDDNCPDVAGVVDNKGCPWPDTDKDGVIDSEDDCPTVAGLKELKGCPAAPILKVEDQKLGEKVLPSLEFAVGKDMIKLSLLIELADLMKQHADEWTLKLAGHTDSRGDSLKNIILSEKRVKSVKKFLVSRGVKADKIIIEWFGEILPIADNSTEKGRQKNRRVEAKVEFIK